jgi:hypothetical protein
MTFVFLIGCGGEAGFAGFTMEILSAALRPMPLALLRGVLPFAPGGETSRGMRLLRRFSQHDLCFFDWVLW